MADQNDSPIYTVPPNQGNSAPLKTETTIENKPDHKSWFARHILAEVLGVVMAGAVLAGGFWYQTNKVADNNQPVPQQQQNEFANWQTYKNTKYGYEFKYPENVGALSELDFALVAPSNPNADILVITDQNQSFKIQIDGRDATVVKSSVLADKIMATFSTFVVEEPIFCIQVLTSAKNNQTGEVRSFPTPCDVPEGWTKL